MTEKKNYPVGTLLKSRDGAEVLIVKREGKYVWLEDSDGLVVKFHRNIFNAGFSWHYNTKTESKNDHAKKYKTGDKYTLHCGVEVEVVSRVVGDRKSKPILVVKDRVGNTSEVRPYLIGSGKFNWPFFLSENSVCEVTDGIVYNTLEGVEITLHSHTESVYYHNMEDEFGNIQRCHQKDVLNSRVKWSKLNSSEKHYVYVASLNGQIYYIGSGKGTRLLHVNSGCSNSFLLNKHYFSELEKLKVEVVCNGLSKDEALLLEKQMIRKHKPVYNIMHNTRVVSILESA